MKRKPWFLLIMLFALPVLSACSTAVETAAPAQTGAESTGKISADDCATPEQGNLQLLGAAYGTCFLYPDHYDVAENADGSGFTLYVRSPLNTEAPLLTFSVEPANGRSLDEVTAQRLTDYAFPDTQPQAITLGGQPANLLDNLPGQDINRRVVAIHNDTVYDLVFNRVGADYGAVGEQTEALYATVTDSLQFVGIEPGAPLLAGPECPTVAENTTLYTNEVAGYCLLVPASYTVQEVAMDVANNEIAFYVDSLQDVSHARLFITAVDAGGQSLEEVTAAKEAELEAALPGFDVTWSFGYMLDGVPANQFDQVPGQDLSRQVVMAHNGRVITLTFIPDDPNAGDAYGEMQSLYEIVMDSFSFLWQS